MGSKVRAALLVGVCWAHRSQTAAAACIRASAVLKAACHASCWCARGCRASVFPSLILCALLHASPLDPINHALQPEADLQDLRQGQALLERARQQVVAAGVKAEAVATDALVAATTSSTDTGGWVGGGA